MRVNLPHPFPSASASARRWLMLGVWLGGLCWGAPAVAAAAPAPTAVGRLEVSEYEVKAAYLVRFTRYIEWPAAALPPAGAPIVIGVLGRNPFEQSLDKLVRGATSQGRPVVLRQLSSPREARTCHLVFIARGQEREEAAWIDELSRLPVVTVGDSPESLARGAIMALYKETAPSGPRVVFAASLPAARLAGVQLGASMLSSARELVRIDDGGGKQK